MSEWCLIAAICQKILIILQSKFQLYLQTFHLVFLSNALASQNVYKYIVNKQSCVGNPQFQQFIT